MHRGTDPGRRRRFSRAWLFALALIALVALAAGCGGDDDGGGGGGAATSTGGEQAAETQEVTFLLPFRESIAFIGLVVAQDRFYKELGLDVKTPATDGDSFVSQQLVAGREKFGLTGAPEVMIANTKDQDLVSVANVNRNIFTMVAPEGAGVATVEDLRGKSLGVTDLGGGEMPLVKGVLSDAGLKENDDLKVVVVGEGGPAVASALKNGRIDAFAGAINDVAAIQASGAVARLVPILPEKFADLPSNVIVAKASTLQNPEDRDTAIKLAKGWRMGTEFAMNDPKAALDIACKRIPEDCQNMKVAQAYLDVAIAAEKPPQQWGLHDAEKNQTVKDSIAAAQIEGDVDLE
ncbi:MAG: NitT/TauT family transport system substrate-binding protein, partial [Solirubrobacteraceae bacterium]|nr:NitT/TauT family transport system substrate-binding protein [Solirubrobacteraceae bacterium]